MPVILSLMEGVAKFTMNRVFVLQRLLLLLSGRDGSEGML